MRPLVSRLSAWSSAWGWSGGCARLSAALVVALAAGPVAQEFASHLPEAVPSLAGWEKMSGSADMVGGGTVQYELYVNPRTLSRYDVIRYRITGRDGQDADSYPSTERLQWQLTERELRRFECVPSEGRSCRWREMAVGSHEYHREMPVILWVLALHRQLLQERDAGRLR